MNNNTELSANKSSKTALANGKEYPIEKLIEQLDHPYAPTITEIIVKGRSITTKVHNRGPITVVFNDYVSAKQFLNAARKNQQSKGGAARGTLKTSIPAGRDTTFAERRTAAYHFGEGASW